MGIRIEVCVVVYLLLYLVWKTRIHYIDMRDCTFAGWAFEAWKSRVVGPAERNCKCG
jgi:hypothetical protein